MATEPLSGFERRLIDAFQQRLPLTPRPYEAMAQALDTTEAEVLAALIRLTEAGVVSRVGPVFRPRTIGDSTLAALSVPPEELESVAALINEYHEVNHNYERAHLFNLWFVVTASDRSAVDAVLRDIRRRSGYWPLDLPMETAYHIDLGFTLSGAPEGERSVTPRNLGNAATPLQLSAADEALVAALQEGIALTREPFAEVAARSACDEATVLRRLEHWTASGIVKRFGIVVRHHELGYRANGMVVWDIPEARVDTVGKRFASYEAVRLCYRRPRRAPRWPFNLFCMIHGQDRSTVRAHIKDLAALSGLCDPRYAVLFSVRRFKQRGAVYRQTGLTPAQRVPACAPQARLG